MIVWHDDERECEILEYQVGDVVQILDSSSSMGIYTTFAEAGMPIIGTITRIDGEFPEQVLAINYGPIVRYMGVANDITPTAKTRIEAGQYDISDRGNPNTVAPI